VKTKRRIFIAASVALSAAVALTASAVALAWRHGGRRVSRSDYEALQTQLDKNPKALYVFDEATSYRLKPLYRGSRWGTKASPHETNSRGLLGAAEIDPSPAVRKVVFLGDSVTYGDAVPFDKAFVSLLQATAGPTWQILNAGTPGWSTHQELRYFDRYLWDVNWRAVVIVFCLNDLVKFEWVWRSERAINMTDEIAALDGLRGLKKETTKSLELMALRTRLRAHRSTAVLAELNSASLRAWTPDDWQSYADTVLEPWLRTRGSVPVMIVIAPAREQLKALALGAPRERALWPQHQMLAICARAEIVCVDPIDDLQSARTVEEADRLFRDDLHFTEAGHAALARVLWPKLLSFVEQQAH
jgi:lysophospholipase L1-like esterase